MALASSEQTVISGSEEVAMRKPPTGRYAMRCTMIATISSILLGYDMGIMSGALLFVKEDLKLGIVQQEAVVGSLSLVSIVGAAIGGRLSDAIGRRLSMAVSAVTFLLGAFLMAFAPSFVVLMLGRILSGVAVGLALLIAPVYSAELSPAHVRGSLVSLTEITINFGILLGFVVSLALAGLPTHLNWRLMLGFGAFPSILLLIGVFLLPESPRWLVATGKIEQATSILIKASGGDKEEARLRLQDIVDSISSKKKQGEGVWRELLFPSPPVRRMLVVALGIHFFHQACGIDTAVYYSPVVFRVAGITSKVGLLSATVGVGVTKFLFIFVAFFLFDRVGRKPLLLISVCGLSLSLAAVATSFVVLHLNSGSGDSIVSVDSKHSSAANTRAGAGPIITIVALCSYVAFFSMGLGPCGWVITSEIFPLRLRSQAMAAAIVLNRAVGGTIALTFLSISAAITPAGTMFIFAGVTALSILFIYFFVPETKGKTLEEMSNLFERPKDTNSNLHS